MRLRALLLFLLACPLPARTSLAAGPANAPVALGKEYAVDLPPTWAPLTTPAPELAFTARTEARIIASLRRVGQRPTDLPYAIVEEYRPDADLVNPANNTRRVTVERLADYYRTALNPPSKADRSPSWRKARVSAVQYDGTADRFRLDATLTYDTVGDLHVVVAGQFDRDRVLIFSGWSDDAFEAAHPGELAAIRDSLRLIGPNGLAAASPGASARTFAQVVVGLIVLAVVVVQLVVLVRDRRARQAEIAEFL